jgi:NADPH:quinone reductase-like Zn-dependent oxidoreductase
MRAAVMTGAGGPEVLALQELPDPGPGPGEVTIRLRFAALNHLDLWVRRGTPAYRTTYPHVGGSDGAGTIEEVGPGVQGLRPGDQVAVDPWIYDADCYYCRQGQTNECPNLRIVGAHVQGTNAELIRLPARNALLLPPRLSLEEISSMPLVFSTAWHMLIVRARLRAGETCLVLAGASGVGSAAIQIARLAGARIIATGGSQEKLELARSLGAEQTVNHRTESISDAVKAFTAGAGVDVVVEHVGPATFEESLRSLARGGRLVTCGATTGPLAQFDIRYLFTRQLSIIGSMGGNRHDMDRVMQLAGEGKLRPVIDRVFPLSDARAAHERLEAGQHLGNILIQIGG